MDHTLTLFNSINHMSTHDILLDLQTFFENFLHTLVTPVHSFFHSQSSSLRLLYFLNWTLYGILLKYVDPE